VGTFKARFYWCFEAYRLATKSVAALAFLAKEAAPRLWPLTDQTPLQVEAGMAALGAEGVMVVNGGRGQFHPASRVAAEVPPPRLGKLSHFSAWAYLAGVWSRRPPLISEAQGRIIALP
jgi:hypothetical protein